MSNFCARPHLRWQQNPDGTPLLVDGRLQPVTLADGTAVIHKYTVALGGGDECTRLSTGLTIPWPGFKTKKAAEAFCAAH